ncbi:Conserved hypothetical protein [gamma proteobacterium HdN1]|nr:Conserved hypothetical protein [gamma proteobacterium HdN1]
MNAHLDSRWPTDAVLPDYGFQEACGFQGIYGLAHGLRRWLHDPQGEFSYAGIVKTVPAVVVLWVVDGLGFHYLNGVGAKSELAKYCKQRLTSVFPSTTASAITTLMTGTSPAQHGLNGWFIRDVARGGVLAPLPLYLRGGDGQIDVHEPSPLFREPSMFFQAQRPVVTVSPREIAFSTYSQHHAEGAYVRPYKGLAALEQEIVEAVRGFDRRGGLVHAYYPRFDGIRHKYGAHSAQAEECFWKIDATFARLCERLKPLGASVLVTADHGFIDSSPEKTITIGLNDPVKEMLDAPLFGERRLAFCAVRHGAEADFESWAAEILAQRAVCVRGAECIASGVFGPGKPHPLLAERVGSHVLLMEPGWTIVDHVEGEVSFDLIGVHGGLTANEMYVPLVVC